MYYIHFGLLCIVVQFQNCIFSVNKGIYINKAIGIINVTNAGNVKNVVNKVCVAIKRLLRQIERIEC